MFAKLILAGDYEKAVSVAQQQVDYRGMGTT